MRKTVILGLVLGLLISSAAGASLDTVLHTSNLNEDFELKGDIVTNVKEDKSLDIVLDYKLKFINENYNRTTVDFFELQVRGDGRILDSKKTSSFSLDLEENRTGFMELKVDKPALIEKLYFHANHTAVVRSSGEKIDRYTFISLDYDPQIPEQKIENLTTNQTQAYRGEKIYITGKHSNIAFLNISGQVMNLEGGRIKGWLDLPRDIDSGLQRLPLDINTGWGKEFRKTIDIEIVNRPPNITLNYPEKVKKGETIEIDVSTIDDRAVTNLSLNFQGTEYTSSGTFNISTDDLKTGNYGFSVVATDSDGAKTRKNESFQVLKENKNGGGGGSAFDQESSEEDKEEDKEESTGSIPVIRQFRNTMESIMNAIIWLF